MNTNNHSILPVSENGKQDKTLDLKMHSFDLFNDRTHYMNGTRMYYAYFEEIPSHKIIQNINCNKAIEWVETKFNEQIVKKHFREDYSQSKKEMELAMGFYVFKNKILIRIENNHTVCVYHTQENEQQAQEILDGFKKFFLRSPSESYIQLVIREQGELQLEWIKNKKVKLVLEKNYNDDLIPIHKLVVKELKTKGNNGLILFHGKPGTGKSTYLRYVIHIMRKKSIIFLSPKLAQAMDSPSLTKLLVQNKDSILIIEDAEDLIMSRGKGNDSSISTLLNLSDGILGESLGIHVICTFNTALSNIDKALLRKGRLIALYEFNALANEKAQQLSDSLGYETQIDSDMTLADIFHQEEMDFDIKRKEPMGFAIN